MNRILPRSPGTRHAHSPRAWRLRRWQLALLGVLLTAPPLSRPSAAEPITNEMCMGCHSDVGLTRDAGGSVHVDLAKLQRSPHGRLACAACHKGVTELPHPAQLPSATCGACHQDAASAIAGSVHRRADGAGCMGCHGTGHVVRRATRTGIEGCARCHAQVTARYRTSVHGMALSNGDPEASTCRDCHGPFHSIRRHEDPLSPVSRASLPKTCAHCHANRALMTRRKITIPEAYALYEKSTHGRSQDPRAATCSDCHESHDLRRATDPASSIYHANVPRTCGRCHAQQSEAYLLGIHGQALQRGVTAAPNCTDCHGEHLIRGPHDAGSPVLASAVSTTCSHCHEAQGLRETYGLPAGRLNTYQDSFHGLAARGGSHAVANCASCHGYHDILPSSDPRSAVSPQRLSETCGKCHPGAGNRLTMGPVHVAAATSDNPIIYYVRWGYLWLIFGTIGGMALHQGLDFIRKLQRHWRRHRGQAEAHHGPLRWHLRMTRFERLQHLLLLASFFILVGTGFALKFPESWLFSWLASLEGGSAWRSVIHRVAAVVMIATSLLHVGYLFTKRGRGTFAALFPTLRDARELLANVLYLAGLKRTPPAFDRFSYIEKAEYWALVWGTVVMTATGFVLWFENQSLRWLPKWTIDLATLVHYYEAWLAFLAILVWHIYQNVLNPDVYPMSWTWVTGLISDEQLQHEHAAEWLRLTAEEEVPADEAAATGSGMSS